MGCQEGEIGVKAGAPEDSGVEEEGGDLSLPGVGLGRHMVDLLFTAISHGCSLLHLDQYRQRVQRVSANGRFLLTHSKKQVQNTK